MSESLESRIYLMGEILDRMLKSNTETTKSPLSQSTESTEKGENPKERLGRLKPDLSLIPPAVLVLEALAMMQGDDKYGAYNWRKTKVQARTYIAATMRHLAAWLDGEEVAVDSGIHHLAHARASLGVVMDAQLCGMMVDDRPRKGVAGRLIEENVVSVPTGGEAYGKIPDGGSDFSPAADPKSPDLLPPAPTFYISGPMRGIPDFNFPAFDEARDRGRWLGYTIISPADMDREVGIDENTNLLDAGVDVRTFVKRDVDILLSLSPKKGDGIALLPGWEKSTGALAELLVARWLGLRIVSAITFGAYKYQNPAEAIAEIARTISYYGKGA